MRKDWWKILLMMLGQGASMATIMVSVSFASLAAVKIAPDPALATLPQALSMTCMALVTAPLSMLMGRYGRRAGFVLGACCGFVSGGLSIHAISVGSFPLLCLAAALLGVFGASGQYYRFAAAEIAGPAHASKAISAVLLGGIGAAISVPAMTDLGLALLPAPPLAGAFLAIIAYAGIAFLAPLFAHFAPLPEKAADRRTVSRWNILRRPAFLAGALTAGGAYAAMSLLMTATPLAMSHAGHGAQQATEVIQAHVIAMYLPSLFSGWMIARLGPARIIILGILILIGAIFTAQIGLGMGHFTLALVLLGLGWNLLFVAGTSIVTQSYSAEERATAQGLNEVIVFGTAATAALASGALLKLLGWQTLTLYAVAILGLIAAVNIYRHRRERRAA